ncbi:hypothetical protein [Sulfurospirillum sp.]|uniref:hypothetical protein n=1 Tax=Sulfurospirillum sp. TaxID=2053622 RepID=UPI002FDEB730
MKLQKLILTLLGSVILSSSALLAADFDWIVSLNVRSHEDPYSYRYGLADRFGYREPDVMVILSSVYAPADAYMIFRLAELSGRTPEYILRVYRERRNRGWGDIAYNLGVRLDSNEYIELRERHDLHYAPRYNGHYEDRREMPVRKVYVEKRYYEVSEPERHDRRDHDRRDDRDDDRRDDGHYRR